MKNNDLDRQIRKLVKNGELKLGFVEINRGMMKDDTK